MVALVRTLGITVLSDIASLALRHPLVKSINVSTTRKIHAGVSYQEEDQEKVG